MKSPSEAKARARKLRELLSAMGYQLKHSESLEVISKFEGYPDWNTYTAELSKGQQTAEECLDDKNSNITTTSPDSLELPQLSKILYCSFCGRSQHQVRKLIAGPNVWVCSMCTDLCIGMILEVQEDHEAMKPEELKDMPILESIIQKAQDKEN